MSDPKSVFVSFATALLKGDLENALQWLDPGIVIHEPAGLPYGGEFRGHAGFRELTARMHDYWETMSGSPDMEMFVDGDTLFVAGALQGRVRASGQELRMPILERHRIRNGRIVESWPFYYCTHTVRQAALPS